MLEWLENTPQQRSWASVSWSLGKVESGEGELRGSPPVDPSLQVLINRGL